MHNLLPHKMKFSKIDLYFRRKITRQARAIIFHSDQAKSEFTDKFGQGEASYEVIPHGAYPESLVPLPNREEAREYLGVPDDAGTVCLFMGRANDQKGYDIALSHLDHLHEKDIHVIFAGADFKREHFADYKNCTVRPYFIPDFELPVLFAAADSVLLPYRSCTTSGVAVLAIGFGIPVVCSDLPALREICMQNMGIVCNHLDPEGFSRAITAAKELNNTEEYQASRNKFLAECSWDNVAEATLKIYNRLF
jgi:glycosyltransferase involved in cell wall biosynthesis